MTQFGSAVGWLVLSPIALITNVIGIVIVCHYRSQFHGTDVAFISLFVSMVMRALLVLPIPAAITIHDEGWLYSELCSFYVWLVLCVRMSELLVTAIMNIHWMCILRFTSGQEVYSSATVVKVLVVIAWVAATVTGLVPVIGSAFYSFYDETSVTKGVQQGDGGGGENVNFTVQYSTVVRGECMFLPRGLGTSFVIFFILITLTTLVISLVASSDTLNVFRYMRKTAIEKYKAGRFYLPSSSLVNNSSTVNNALGNSPQNTGGASYALRGEASAHRTSTASNYQTGSEHGSGRYENNGGVVMAENNGRSAGGWPQPPPGITSSADSSAQRPGSGSPQAGNGVGASSAAAVVVRPSAKSGVAKSSPPTVHAKYNELNLSSELCRVVLCFTLLAALFNHLPFVILQFIQLVQDVNRQDAETTVLWLTLIQSLLVPHVLWVLSRRYRHALSYTWTVHVLRDDSAKEEDPSACTLQSYTRKVRTPEGGTVKVMAKSRGHAPVTMVTYDSNTVPEGQSNGNAVPVRNTSLSRSTPAPIQEAATRSHVIDGARAANVEGRAGATEVMTTDLDDGMTVITNLASHQVTYIYDSSSSDASPQKTQSPESSGNSRRSSHATTSPSRSSLGTPSRGSADIKRSGSARKVWKEQMMKKHLPAIFINEAFEADELAEEQKVENNPVRRLPDVTRVSESDVTVGGAVSQNADGGKSNDTQFHYYMSSDFHHDYLRSDSLPRLESESDGGSFQYDDNDIEGILDREQSTRSAHVSSHMSTFLGDARDRRISQLESSPSLMGSESAVHPAIERHAENPTVKSETKSEGSETEWKQANSGHRKPPRRSGAVLRQTSRPSLQHQKSVSGDLDSGAEDVVDAFHEPSESERNSLTGTFYPVFESVSETPTWTPAVSSEHENRVDVSDQRMFDEERENTSARVSSTLREEHELVVDSADVYLSIDNVTNDATCTDDTGDLHASAHSDVGADSEDGFQPQMQASVLGILLEDGTEIPVVTPAPQLETDDTDLTEHSGYRVSGPTSQSKPFNFESDSRNISLSHTNPFLEDFQEVGSHTETQMAQKNPAYHTDDVSENLELIRITENPEDAAKQTEVEGTSVGSPVSKDGRKKESLMITRVGSDVKPPDTAVVLDIVETSSTGSEPSVVLEPYHGDRRPPWMDAELEDEETPTSQRTVSRNPFGPHPFDARSSEDSDAFGSSGDFGSSFGSSAELGTIFGDRTPTNKFDFGNPFAYDSFTGKSLAEESDSDFLQSSGDSERLNGVRNHSEIHQPYPLFDEETDRGFEDALALEHVIGGNPYYGNFGRCFESIEEEPEDHLTDSMNSSHKEDSKGFSTTAIASPPSSIGSGAETPKSSPFKAVNGDSTLSPQSPSRFLPGNADHENPFASSPKVRADKDEAPLELSPITPHGDLHNSEGHLPNGDLLSMDAEPQDAPRVRLTKPSPWPSVDGKENGLGFDSDFAQTNHAAGGTVDKSEGVGDAKKPPIPPRPTRNGGVGISRGDAVATNHVNPVYF